MTVREIPDLPVPFLVGLGLARVQISASMRRCCLHQGPIQCHSQTPTTLLAEDAAAARGWPSVETVKGWPPRVKWVFTVISAVYCGYTVCGEMREHSSWSRVLEHYNVQTFNTLKKTKNCAKLIKSKNNELMSGQSLHVYVCVCACMYEWIFFLSVEMPDGLQEKLFHSLVVRAWMLLVFLARW